MAKYKNSSGGLGRFWAILLTLILIAGIVLWVVYRKQVAVIWGDLTRYFKRVDDEVPSDDGGDDEVQEVEKRDNMVVSDVESGGLTFAMVPLAASDLSALAESGFTVTATVSPDYATDKTLDWTVEWADSSDFWVTAYDAVVTDYVTITPTADGSNVATVECLKDFGAQIVVKSTARSNPDAYATCTLDYYARVIGADIQITTSSGEKYLAMAEGSVTQPLIIEANTARISNGASNVITSDICGPVVYAINWKLSAYTIALNTENATVTEACYIDYDFRTYLNENGFNFSGMTDAGYVSSMEAYNFESIPDLQYFGLYPHWQNNATRGTAYPSFDDYITEKGAEYLLLANAYEGSAVLFHVTYQDDMNDVTFALSLSYQKDYFDIVVESVEVDNTGAVL